MSWLEIYDENVLNPAPTKIINALFFNMFISKTTSVGAKNFPPANSLNTDPIPPSILNNKNPNANVTPTINTIP